jgi:hypothetical protein
MAELDLFTLNLISLPNVQEVQRLPAPINRNVAASHLMLLDLVHLAK